MKREACCARVPILLLNSRNRNEIRRDLTLPPAHISPIIHSLSHLLLKKLRRHMCRIFGGVFHLMEPSRNISKYSGETRVSRVCVFVFVHFDQTAVIQSLFL